jgi:hypothetical protein
MSNRIAWLISLLLGTLLAVWVLAPALTRTRGTERLSSPEQQRRFLNLRLRKIERQDQKVLLTPLRMLGFDIGPGSGSDRPLLVAVGSTFKFVGARPQHIYVVRAIAVDGISIGYGPSSHKLLGSTKLEWK